MTFLADSPNLGSLEILEVYVQYNGPRLLSCKNDVSKIFLALWVDEEEDHDFWLYMLVSLDRLQLIRTGQISLHQAFLHPESSFLYEVIYTYINSEWQTRKVSIEEIDQDCLPLEGNFLNCLPQTLPQLDSQESIQYAITKNREFVKMALEPLSTHPYEFPAIKLGKILCTFQDLLNQLFKSEDAEMLLTAQDISKRLELNVLATTPGSFQIELASSMFESDIFGNSLAGDAIEKLFNLIKIRNNVNDLQKFMLNVNKKASRKYRFFLEALVSSGTGIVIEWGSPTITRGDRVEADLTFVSQTLELIKKIDSLENKQHEVIGEIFKIDTKNWKFGIQELKNNFLYTGDILEQAKADARTATISRIYVAVIIEIPEIAPATNQIKRDYKLLSLMPYEPSNGQLSLIDSTMG